MWHSKGESVGKKLDIQMLLCELATHPDFVMKDPSFPKLLCFSANQAEQELVHIILLCV